MLTIYTVPKAFHGHISVIQRNAIQSWTLLTPCPEIILFGDDEGTFEIAPELNLHHVPEVARNEYGTPILSDIFEKVRNIARNDLLAYINSDIILFNDIYTAVRSISFEQFVLVGQRYNLDVPEPIDFQDAEWEKKLRLRVQLAGSAFGVGATDIFIFPRDLEWHMPPFALGRGWTDIWMLYKTRSIRLPLIDATEIVLNIHQNHGFEHIRQTGTTFRGIEGDQNLELAGGSDYIFSLEDANYLATAQGLKRPKWNRRRWLRNIYTQALIDYHPGPVRAIVTFLFKRRWWADYVDHYYYRRRIRKLFQSLAHRLLSFFESVSFLLL